jgi:cob(I)alamin adenosyltransferase
MMDQKMEVDLLVIRYLNRLSDYLFMLARYLGKINSSEEIPWKARI